jgi:hypothetical protein
MGKWVAIALMLIAAGICYLGSTGHTVNSSVAWVKKQFGVGDAGKELKTVPYHNYAPAVH